MLRPPCWASPNKPLQTDAAARLAGYAEVGDGGGFDVIGPDIIPALRAFSLLPLRLSFVYQCSHPWGKRDVHTPRGLAGGTPYRRACRSAAGIW